MRARVALRQVAVDADHVLELRPAAGRDRHARADRRPLAALHPRVDLQPVVAGAAAVAQQVRRAGGVDHEQVDVAVVVEVGPGGAAAHPLRLEEVARLARHVDEDALAVVARQHRVLRVLVVRVAVGDEDVEVAVVVVVEEHGAPAGVLAADDGEARAADEVGVELALLREQAAVVHVRDQDVEVAVAVEVGHRRAHRRDALAVLAEREAELERLLDERPVAPCSRSSSSPSSRWRRRCPSSRRC